MELSTVRAGVPVEWIRLDPAREWLADVSCAQTELMLANQLQHSKDVHAQVPVAAHLPRVSKRVKRRRLLTTTSSQPRALFAVPLILTSRGLAELGTGSCVDVRTNRQGMLDISHLSASMLSDGQSANERPVLCTAAGGCSWPAGDPATVGGYGQRAAARHGGRDHLLPRARRGSVRAGAGRWHRAQW